ncbi:MAG: 1,4-dihydroxy-2-naphthoate octaprenyltransferase [Prevotella sp.]|nr:1,4-dihydroxy-2-naphthoate octaprenyltransferase [Prevotella sp.]MCM1074811.1 1,4-dihydroxy-2-naphthoate octaprenyltransferase [Ruminococcus sp.]
MNLKAWIEATRPRTLPVSVAGVIIGAACAAHYGQILWSQALLCLMFAVLAQIASNFANEYFDYKAGLDKKGREGFRRGVTEGDISPRAMLAATLGALGICALLGLGMLLISGQWWLIAPGILIGLFALAYSTGPWPLSHHGLGDLAVIIFFGLVPVLLTSYLCAGAAWTALPIALPTGVSIGLLAANVLIVNNYRDMEDDKDGGKHTTVVLFGRNVMSIVYLIFGLAAVAIMWPVWKATILYSWILIILYLAIHRAIWLQLRHLRGAKLNPLLGLTAMNLLMYSLLTSAALIFSVSA